MEGSDKFGHLEMAPPDVILGTALAFKADTDANKVNLGIGAYRDEQSKPFVFPSVRQVEMQLAKDTMDGKLDKEYQPVQGWAPFNQEAQKMLFGAENPLVKEGKICTIQALSGTGALRVGFEFLKIHSPGDCYTSNPTWANHVTIIKKANLPALQYPYFHPETKGLDYKGFVDCLKQAKEGSIFLLHVCAHNPTGVDPTPDQWKELAKIFKERKLFPFFDSAYQGYASGLYGERIGALHFVCKSKEVAEKLQSQANLVVRPMYSNPPIHGARLVHGILSNPELRKQWEVELKEVSGRITKMRSLLRAELEKIGTPGTWNHITDQIGMFSYTGLNSDQCEILINKWHIYLVKNGRISMAGVTTTNVPYIAKAMKDALESIKK